MRRTIITALIALTTLGGVASADRDRRGDRGDRGGDRWRHHDNGGVRVERRNYHRPRVHTYRASRVYVRPSYRQVYRPHVRVVRQPIYVQRPVIRYRYYDQYQRPQLLVENYPARAGYIWIAGQWTWSGYEWTWQPGHYQPDQSYDQQYNSYDNGQYYDGQYYDGQYQQPYTSPSVGGSLNLDVSGSYSF